MPKYRYRPRVTVDAQTPIAARNELLRLLAQAELDGRIDSFSVPHKPEAEK